MNKNFRTISIPKGSFRYCLYSKKSQYVRYKFLKRRVIAANRIWLKYVEKNYFGNCYKMHFPYQKWVIKNGKVRLLLVNFWVTLKADCGIICLFFDIMNEIFFCYLGTHEVHKQNIERGRRDFRSNSGENTGLVSTRKKSRGPKERHFGLSRSHEFAIFLNFHPWLPQKDI